MSLPIYPFPVAYSLIKDPKKNPEQGNILINHHSENIKS